MADEMAVHPNTIRFHLDALVRTGRVEQVLGDTAGPGRPPVLFRASRRMDPAGPTNYRLLASILTGYRRRHYHRCRRHRRTSWVARRARQLVAILRAPRTVENPRDHRTG